MALAGFLIYERWGRKRGEVVKRRRFLYRNLSVDLGTDGNPSNPAGAAVERLGGGALEEAPEDITGESPERYSVISV